MCKIVQKLILISILSMLSLQALSDTYGAMALDEHGGVAWSIKSTEAEAQLDALRACEEDGLHVCSLVYHTALIIAESKKEKSVGFGMSDKSLYDIQVEALAECGKSDCVVKKIITEPGFVGLAMSNTEPKNFGWVYGYNDALHAAKEAVKVCNKNKSGSECTDSTVGLIRGNLDAENIQKNTSVSTQPQSCRPNTNPIRCTSNCVNGNCKVTYENGCVIEVTVQPKYDPLNNMWMYPSPQC